MKKVSLKRTISLICCAAVLLSSTTTMLVTFADSQSQAAPTPEDIIKSCVDEKGNAITESYILEQLKAEYSDAVIDESFIYHAVDGVYDEDPIEADRLSIPGHDGYVAVIATIGEKRYSNVVRIPHVEENLGVLTKDVYVKGSDTDAFTEDENGNIIGYTGTAQKIVIGADCTGNINSLSPSESTINNTVAIVLKNGGKNIGNYAVRGYSTGGFIKLKAVMISDSTTSVGEYSFDNDISLKYVKLPENMGGGRLEYRAFSRCSALENINLPDQVSMMGRTFYGTGLRSIYEGENTIHTKADDPWFDDYGDAKYVGGTRVIMTAVEQKTASFTRAAVLAQAFADTESIRALALVTQANIKNRLDGAYKDYNSEITSAWQSFNKVNNKSISAVLVLDNGMAQIPVTVERNEDIAINNIDLGEYQLTPEFDIDTKEYTATVPNGVQNLIVNIYQNHGAKNVTVEGNHDLIVGSNTVLIKAKSVNNTSYEYKITVTRLEPTPFEKMLKKLDREMNAYTFTNDTERLDISNAAEKIVKGENYTVMVTDFYKYKAIGGATENNGAEILVPGRKGYITTTIKLENDQDSKVIPFKLTINPDMEDYTFASVSSENDFVISQDGKTLLSYEGDAEKVVIPEGIKYIDELYFYSDPSVVKCLILPDSLKQLPLALCNGMRNLEVAVMGDNVVDAEDDIFKGCASLKYVRLSENLPDLSNSMFATTLSLAQLYIPQSVTIINSNTFYRSLIRDITLAKTVTKIRDNAFAWPINRATYFVQASLGALLDAEKADYIQSNVVEKWAYKDGVNVPRTITILNENIEVEGAVFCTDETGAWGLNIVVSPENSTVSKNLNSYGDETSSGPAKKNQKVLSMSFVEAAARAQIAADGLCVTADGTADDVMKIIKDSYLCDQNLDVSWSVPFSKTATDITGVITIASPEGIKFDIEIGKEIFVPADTDLSDKGTADNSDEDDSDDYDTDYDNNYDYDYDDTDYNTDDNTNTGTEDDGPKTKTVKVLKRVKMKRPGTPEDYSIFGISPWIWIPSISVLALAGIGTCVFFIVKAAKKKKRSSNS